ncbi:unnamed protein product, partial [Adineta ricciae]
MEVESSSSEEELSDNELDSQIWNKIDSESDDNTIYPIDCYRHFITDEIINLMVHETNRYAQQHLQAQELAQRSKALQWKPTTHEEMLKFLGIIIEMGLVRMSRVNYYWSKSKLYGSEVIQNTMSRDKFELLLKFYHFSKNEEQREDDDILFKLKPLLSLLQLRFMSVYVPGQLLLLMKQWSHGKVASTTGYTCNFMVYTGKQSSIAGHGHAETVVMQLLTTSLQLFLLYDIYYKMIHILLELSEVTAPDQHNKYGIKLIKWKDKRDVLMISTKPSHSTAVTDTKTINKLNERSMKTQVILDYNEGKQGIDLSDQLSSYYTCLSRSIKWYQKVAFELIFGTSIVNAYLIYKEKYSTSNMTMLQFRESLMRSLLLGVPFENLKPGPKQQPTNERKRKHTDHLLEEMKGTARNGRRRCVGCYEKIRQQQSREASAITAKRMTRKLNRISLIKLFFSALIPFTIGLFTVITTIQQQKFSSAQREQDKQDALLSRQQSDLHAENLHKEKVYETYLDDVSELFTMNNSKDTLMKIRAKTLASLRQLDRERKKHLLLFLYDSELIYHSPEKAISSLLKVNEADFNGVNFRGTVDATCSFNYLYLHHVYLSKASFINCFIDRSNFSYSIMYKINFTRTRFFRTSFRFAVLNQADFSQGTFFEMDFVGAS